MTVPYYIFVNYSMSASNFSIFFLLASSSSPIKLEIKSKLSQYLSIANMYSNGYIKELELVVHEKEDMDRLIEFMLSGENPK